MKYRFLLLAFFMSLLLTAQDDPALKSQVRHTIDELIDFISIPNDAVNHADINRNITWLTRKFTERGFNTSVLPTDEESLFFAALPMQDNKPTLLFYMHFDGQSVDPGKWTQPDPYKVVLKAPGADGGWEPKAISDLQDDIPYDWRLFGRSVSDDKGPIVMFLNAMDLLKKKGTELPYNLKVILDGQEERGSEPLPKAVETYRELLQADYLLIADGPVHYSGLPTVVYGCRGITTLTLTTYGPIRPQHSGHYGNYAPNPNFQMARILSSMKDVEGRVIIDGYYDGISLTEAEEDILRSVPDEAAQIDGALQIAQPDKVGAFYQESIQYPSLNVRGYASGWVGDQARTIVPASATAELDLRLVPESDGHRLIQLVKDHIESLGYRVTDKEPDEAMRSQAVHWVRVEESGVMDAFRTSLDDPFGQHLVGLLGNTFGESVVQIRISGGTVPIAPFVNALEIPAFLLPLVNPDNNQHSPDENLRIGQIAYGLRALTTLLSTPAP